MSTISLTMPLEAEELRKNGNMLLEMASSLDGEVGPATVTKRVEEIVEEIENDIASDEEVEETTAPTATGVELDKAGLPWDARIHGAKKLKTAKEQTWKKIRGVDPELVKTVEAELRAALVASPAEPVEAVAPAPKPAAPAPAASAPAPALKSILKYVTPQGNFTEDELVAAGWTSEQVKALPVVPLDSTTEKDDEIDALSNTGMTFPEFMAKVTREQAAGEIDQAAVLAAVNAQGLASLPLLATRPDLIPAIDTALFGE